MKSYLEVILEKQESDTHVLHFGRMTVPTSGHNENVTFAQNLAKKLGASLSIVTARTFGGKKDPLPPSVKLKHLNRAFPDAHIKMATKKVPTILQHAAKASKRGKKHLVVVAGADRVDTFSKLLNNYNGKLYNFDSIKVVSSGERKAGVSGTSMRSAAATGDYEGFRKGLAPNLQSNPAYSQDIYNDLRKKYKKGKR